MSDTSAPREVKHSIKCTKGTQISSLWLLTTRIVSSETELVCVWKEMSTIHFMMSVYPTYVYL
jgi:hypothetical protein